jgi:hypothetical protein
VAFEVVIWLSPADSRLVTPRRTERRRRRPCCGNRDYCPVFVSLEPYPRPSNSRSAAYPGFANQQVTSLSSRHVSGPRGVARLPAAPLAVMLSHQYPFSGHAPERLPRNDVNKESMDGVGCRGRVGGGGAACPAISEHA